MSMNDTKRFRLPAGFDAKCILPGHLHKHAGALTLVASMLSSERGDRVMLDDDLVEAGFDGMSDFEECMGYLMLARLVEDCTE